MKTGFLTVLLLANSALALEKQTYVCAHGDQERLIEVTYAGAAPVPCQVTYTKDSVTQNLWQAQNLEGYCESQALDFVEKQRGWGWLCSAVASADVAESAPSTDADVLAATAENLAEEAAEEAAEELPAITPDSVAAEEGM